MSKTATITFHDLTEILSVHVGQGIAFLLHTREWRFVVSGKD